MSRPSWVLGAGDPAPSHCPAPRRRPQAARRSLLPGRPLVAIDALACGRVGHEVHVPLLVLTEGHDRHPLVRNRPVGDDALLGFVVLEGPELVGHVVGIQVVTLELGDARPAIHGAARDRLADIVVVLPDRFDVLRPWAGALGPERVQPLTTVPAVVAARHEDVDFLPQILTDVPAPKRSSLPVERDPPRVAHAVAPDLRAGALL